jgi:NADH-quinone oxidoreductase subunit N
VNDVDWTRLLDDVRDLAMPELILTAFGCLALVLDVILPRRQRRVVAYAALGGVALSLASVVVTGTAGVALPRHGFFDMVVVDELALVFKAIVLVALALSIALSIRYLDLESEQRGEFYALMCFATVGMMFLASGSDLLTLYVSLELMALSVYVLVGYHNRNRASNEAALKYFLLGAFSSSVLLYGMSLLYGLTGTTNLGGIAAALPRLASGAGAADARFLLLVAVVLMAAGLCFKIAAVPFHMWAPDAYEGAPTPVTAFMSVGVKAASFALFVRLFLDGIPGLRSLDESPAGALPGWGLLLGVVAAVTMTWGNLGALTQKNAKRLLAYSSIAHAGYLLLGILAGNEHGYTGLVIYLVVYVFMNLGAFGVLVALHRRGIVGDRIEDFNGLAHRAPGLAALMTIFLLSLGGIPPTAGFIGKFYLFYGLVDSGEPWLIRLALLALLNTAVSAYYYLQFVKAMYMGEADDEAPAYETSGGVWATVGIAAALTIGIGVYPQPAIAISKRAVERVKPAPVRTDGGSEAR